MASSAVYRYFPSRDDLLTALIVDAYDAIGDGGGARRGAPGDRARDLRGRWRAACRAVRGWALAHPHEYALVYGSPVPGYAAPESTIGPAARVGELLCRIVADGIARRPGRPGERRRARPTPWSRGWPRGSGCRRGRRLVAGRPRGPWPGAACSG